MGNKYTNVTLIFLFAYRLLNHYIYIMEQIENKTELTPKQIVERLDSYIIGQEKAKRAVAVALRNRFRRLKLSE